MTGLRRRIVTWIWHTQDRLPDRILDSRAYDLTFRAVLWAGCRLAGHQPERDQCGMPEHDYCLWCNKLMPFAARQP